MPSVKISPAAWLTIKFQKTISNSLSVNEKQELYKQFATQCEHDFEAKDFNQFVYLDQLPYGKDLKNYQSAIAAKDDVVTGADTFILSGVDTPFAARNGDKLAWIFGSFGIGAGVFLLILQFIKIRNTANVKLLYKRKLAGGSALKNLLWPKPGFVVTPIVINLNLLIFIIMVCCGLGFISFDAADLLAWGGNYRPSIRDGEYWRLLTNMFLHGGLIHIVFNMYGLLFVGIILEPMLGSYKYAALYLVTGVLASITSVCWHPATVSVGASGAIFGLYGAFLALLTTNLFPPQVKKSFLLNTAVFVGYNLLFGLAGGIDNAAHIGGLLSGLLGGYILSPFLKKEILHTSAKTEEGQMLKESPVDNNIN
jgi:rhomboid protease GluP